jgi:transposase
MRQINYQKRLTGFLAGRKCVFCGSRKVCITKRRYVKCLKCLKQKSLRRLRFEIEVIIAFVHQRPAYQVAVEYGVSYQSIHNIFRTIREILFHQTELEGKKLSGQIEIDEAYFGGRKKGNIGRRVWSKSVVFGLLERDGRVYTRVVDNLTAQNLMEIIKKQTRKGSVYFTDKFRSLQFTSSIW